MKGGRGGVDKSLTLAFLRLDLIEDDADIYIGDGNCHTQYAFTFNFGSMRWSLEQNQN